MLEPLCAHLPQRAVSLQRAILLAFLWSTLGLLSVFPWSPGGACVLLLSLFPLITLRIASIFVYCEAFGPFCCN